ncbi:N-acetylmuramoyl-L-alanine amidase [Falsiroseomonas sp. HC035]|uniref:peptidoglycan recognition protein family protein n=1 Tax=Falsiroseomonas sp. HC035 TaxID=3390999 RepID=UPI003D310CC9
MADLIPKDWMPDARMERIHVHWTAGRHAANATDRKSYHILIEGTGALVRGDRSIAANARGSGLPPASHTLNANTGAIGVSMCCMHQAEEHPFAGGAAPLLKLQWDTMVAVVAQLARRYAIPVTRATILTHAEVHATLGIPQRNKWDITRLAFDPSVVGAHPVGDRMRLEVAVALDALSPAPTPTLVPERLPRFRVQGVAPSTLTFRRNPAGEATGALPEGTLVERLAMSQQWWQVRTPRGFVGWVSSDFLVAVP